MARHFGSVKTFPLDLIRKSVEPRSGSAPERAFLPAPGFKNSSEYPFRQGGFGCWLERVSGFGFRVSGFGFRVRRSEPCWRWVWGVVPSPAGLAPTRGVLFDRQRGWLLRGPFCSIASRAGSYAGAFCPIASRAGSSGGRFVPSPAGWLLRGGILFHRQQGWLLR